MSSFRPGEKVRITNQSTSRYNGCTGTVVRTEVRGLAVMYEVSLDQHGFPSQDNRFFEYELEPMNR